MTFYIDTFFYRDSKQFYLRYEITSLSRFKRRFKILSTTEQKLNVLKRRNLCGDFQNKNADIVPLKTQGSMHF